MPEGSAPRTVLNPKGELNVRGNLPTDSSTVTEEEIPEIRRKYFIPSDYEVRAPADGETIFNPPVGFTTVFLAALDVGWKVPVPRCLCDVLRSIDLCPIQVLPYSLGMLVAAAVMLKITRASLTMFDLSLSQRHGLICNLYISLLLIM